MLLRTAARIRKFAQAQRDSVKEMEVDIEGGKAGQSVAPMEVAGCYAPGGRVMLPLVDHSPVCADFDVAIRSTRFLHRC